LGTTELAPLKGALDKTLARAGIDPAMLEKVIVNGDLKALTASERISFYKARCEAVGLDPLSQPFQYIVLDGRLTLYTTKGATDQLRKLHGVSVTDLATQRIEDVYVVTAKVQDRNGRTDAGTGAVPIASLKGAALANALMKAETKAKRRATLSICGLGMLDESELDTVSGAKAPPRPQNNSGHKTGQYASEEQVEAYRRATIEFCREKNAEWIDRWTDRQGEIAEGIKELLHPIQMTHHLLKFCLRTSRLAELPMTLDPETNLPTEKVSSEQAKRYVAIVFAREPEVIAEEAQEYFLLKAEEAREAWHRKHGQAETDEDVYSTEGGRDG
jgi:hypothetical protein